MNRTRRSCHELGVCHGRKDQGCACHHDTETLPPGGYYFAPGAIDCPRRSNKRLAGWQRLVLDVAGCLAVAGLIGFIAGVLQARGWPL